jgi:hypothetical protein
MDGLRRLDHMVDRLLCADAQLHNTPLEKAKILIKKASILIMNESPTTQADPKKGLWEKAHDLVIKKISNTIIKNEIKETDFGVLTKKESMNAYFSGFVTYSGVKLYYGVTKCTNGYHLRMSRGFFNTFWERVIDERLGEDHNAFLVKGLLEECMIKI